MKITKHKFLIPQFSVGEIITLIFFSTVFAMFIGMYTVITEAATKQKQVDQLLEFVEQNCTATGIALNKDSNNYKLVYSCPGVDINEVINKIKE